MDDFFNCLNGATGMVTCPVILLLPAWSIIPIISEMTSSRHLSAIYERELYGFESKQRSRSIGLYTDQYQ